MESSFIGLRFALLRLAFPHNEFQANLVERLHAHDRELAEWVCLHANRIIAYIAFSNAYNGELCGLHLSLMAVTPDFQRQGVGAELLRYALRQEQIKDRPLFVHGRPEYFAKFGFEPCTNPIYPFARNNDRFLSLGNNSDTPFMVGYEPEFKPAAAAPAAKGAKGRKK